MHMDLEELTKIININPLAKDQYLTQARKTFKITTKWLHRQVMVGIFWFLKTKSVMLLVNNREVILPQARV